MRNGLVRCSLRWSLILALSLVALCIRVQPSIAQASATKARVSEGSQVTSDHPALVRYARARGYLALSKEDAYSSLRLWYDRVTRNLVYVRELAGQKTPETEAQVWKQLIDRATEVLQSAHRTREQKQTARAVLEHAALGQMRMEFVVKDRSTLALWIRIPQEMVAYAVERLREIETGGQRHANGLTHSDDLSTTPSPDTMQKLMNDVGAAAVTVAGSGMERVTAVPRRGYDALPQKQKRDYAEWIGEKGAEQYAERRGYRALLRFDEKQYPHGFDQVYYDPKTNEVVCIEAKGGSGRLTGRQGTIEDAIEGAKKMLNSDKTSDGERKAAQRVLEHIEKGRARLEVVRTPHVGGVPESPRVVRTAVVEEQHRQLAAQALREAQARSKLPLRRGSNIMHEVERATVVTRVGRATGSVFTAADDVVRGVSKVAVPLEVATEIGGAAYEAYQIERQYRAARISRQQRIELHAQNVVGRAGGAVGGAGGAWGGAVAGATVGSAFGPVGTVVGGVGGAIVGGVAGSKVGRAVGRYVARTITSAPRKLRRWWIWGH